jgi:(p)ppGpp synthase/HD superfamily hydrolase
MRAYSSRYELALRLAAQAHHDQVRKGTPVPYITHVVQVAHLLERHGFDEDLVIAGLLHDVVEDTPVTLETLRDAFGERVARLVEAVTERKQEGGAERPWEARKAEGLERLRAGGPDVAALKAADALHNAQTTAADVLEGGPAVWARFKRGPEPTLWYYAEIVRAVRASLGDHPLALELAEAVDMLAGRR